MSFRRAQYDVLLIAAICETFVYLVMHINKFECREVFNLICNLSIRF